MLSFLWGLVAPWAGPAVAWILPMIPFGGIKKTARVLGYMAALGAGCFVTYWLVTRLRDPVQDYVSAASVEASIERERSAALSKSVQQLHATIEQRDRDVAALEQELEDLRHDMEAARAKSPDPDVVVFPADDPWLLEKRARQR